MDKTGLTEKKVTEKAKASRKRLRRKRLRRKLPFFPDEIITNILIKLPAKVAVRCRLVCRKWRDLTLNRDFVDLHLRNCLPTILVEARECYWRLHIYELEKKWWEPATMENDISLTFLYTGEIQNSYDSGVLFSHDGLVVLLEETSKGDSYENEILILNPARPDIGFVSITFTEELQGSEIYGVYYHPSLKGYCSLWRIGPSPAFELPPPDKFQYKILNLGSNPSLKTISNPFSNRVKMENAIPLLINTYLYWKLESEQGHKSSGHNDIMKFDVLREEFRVIHCPVPLNTECESYQTHLLNVDGGLSFLLIVSNKITIWTLEDHAEQVWMTTEYTFSTEICDIYEKVDVIAVVDGKLALQVSGSGTLCVCNLMEGTAINYPDFAFPATIYCCFSHKMSLASLSNGKTRIFIDQDNKVVVT